MYELSPKDFLFLYYTKMEGSLKKILFLMKKDILSLDEIIQMYELKNNMMKSLDILSLETDSEEFRKSLNFFMKLIISTNNKDIEEAINFCRFFKKE